ncbi:MAG: CFI-box-CTERM domain-containing protein [Pseudomonadota bacterium]
MNKIALLSGAVAILTPAMLEDAAAQASWTAWKNFTEGDSPWKYRFKWTGQYSLQYQIKVMRRDDRMYEWDYLTSTYFIEDIRVTCRNGGVEARKGWSKSVGYYDSDSSKPKIGTVWNHHETSLCRSQGGAKTVVSNKGFRWQRNYDDGCFITTAACKTLGLEDDCRLLQALRHFRDTYMDETRALRADVEKYYDLAPKIVKRIADLGLGNRLYPALARDHLFPAFAQIEGRDFNGAYATYKRMVDHLEAEILR